MDKTYAIKSSDIKHTWHIVDADGQILGRLATRISAVLRGKHKPTFSPNLDNGDFVIVVNADKVRVTGNRLDEKKYYRHSGYPGGLVEVPLRRLLDTHPERAIIYAVKGMLPKTRLGRKMIKKLKVYAGPDHPHDAQQPKELVF